MIKKIKNNILQFPLNHKDKTLFKKLCDLGFLMEKIKIKHESIEDDFLDQILKNIKHDGLAKKKHFNEIKNVLVKSHKDRIDKIKNKLK